MSRALLVEDRPGDVRLPQDAFRNADASIELHVAPDGVEAMAFLRHQGTDHETSRPDILLDLTLPRVDGREVHAHNKADEERRTIPAVILTTSVGEDHTLRSCQLQANVYPGKPIQQDAFESLVTSINDFCLNRARLPMRSGG